MKSIENLTSNQHKTQGFSFFPPPSYARKRKAPEDCYSSFIDQGTDGYSGLKLVRNKPRTIKDKHFILRTFKDVVRSYRRNYSHRGVALFRTKAGGATRANIEYLTCSFLELDGSTAGTIKTRGDVLDLAKRSNLLKGLQISQTSSGHFHVILNYDDPLPFTAKGESFWLSQQKRLIQLFKQSGFDVDVGASLNPCQFLRNPSQLNPYNFKRRCSIEIHKSFNKTSLRAIYRALNSTNIANPRPIPASVKFRRLERENETFITTHKQLGIKLGLSKRTVGTEINKALKAGDLEIVRRTGNNKLFSRATEYRSNLYIQPNSQSGNLSIFKTNAVQIGSLLGRFKLVGAETGKRQRSVFALGLHLKCRPGKKACIELIRDELEGGAMACHLPEREFDRTLKNIMKPQYQFPLSMAKMREWNLIEETGHLH